MHHPENEHVPSGSAPLFEGNKAWHIFGREKMCFVIVFTRPLPDSCLITTMSSTAGAGGRKRRETLLPPLPDFPLRHLQHDLTRPRPAANHAPFTRRRKGGEQSRPLMAAVFGGRRRKKKKADPFRRRAPRRGAGIFAPSATRDRRHRHHEEWNMFSSLFSAYLFF